MNEDQNNEVVLEQEQELAVEQVPSTRQRIADSIPEGSVGVIITTAPHFGEKQGINISMASFTNSSSPLLEVFLERYLSERIAAIAGDLNDDLKSCIKAAEIGEEIFKRSVGTDTFNAIQMMMAAKETQTPAPEIEPDQLEQ